MEYERNADKEGYFNIHKYTTEHYPGFVGVPHFHNSTEIIFVAGGNFSVYLGGESRILHEGEIAYIDALTPHHTVTRSEVGELECYVLVVSPRYLSGVVGVEDNSFGGFLEKNGGFSEIIEFVRWGYSSLSGMNDEMRLGFSTALFGIMKKHYEFHEKQSAKQTQLLLEVMRYIDAHYGEQITLTALAAKFGYEKTYLSKVLNRFLGMNLREYLNRYRIGKISRMRRQNPELSLLRAAERCGFESPNTFYRAYNKYAKKENE